MKLISKIATTRARKEHMNNFAAMKLVELQKSVKVSLRKQKIERTIETAIAFEFQLSFLSIPIR